MMKHRLLLLSAFVLMTSFACFAKKSSTQQQQRDNVINMEVISKMGLSDETVSKVESLFKSKQSEMQSLMEANKPSSNSRPSEEEMETAKERMTLFTAQYRAELKKILGDKYVTYLELYIDSQPQMPQQSGNGGMGNRPPQGGPGGGMGAPGGMGW